MSGNRTDAGQPAGGPPATGAVTPPEGGWPPALGVLELASIARGVVVADAALKRAAATVFLSRPVSTGAYLVMMRGEVAEIDEAMAAARDRAGDQLLDWVELPYAHAQLWPILHAPGVAAGWEPPVAGTGWADDDDAESVALVETQTVCATIRAADAAAKCAPVVLRDVRLAAGIGGKAYFSMTGLLPDVEASAEAARDAAGQRLVNLELIPAPVAELRGRLLF